METGVRYSNAADVTGVLEKLKLGESDHIRWRNRNVKDAEDRGMRRSLSPGLCRIYDWNTTHFYPDIHQMEEPDVPVSTRRVVGRTVRFASESYSSDEQNEEPEEDEEERGEKEEGWKKKKTIEAVMEDEDHEEEESEEYASSSDDFDEWNPSPENETVSDRDANRGCGLKVEASPFVQEDRREDRQARELPPADDGVSGPTVHPTKFAFDANRGEKLGCGRSGTGPSESALHNDERETDDWRNIAGDPEWRSETGETKNQRERMVAENEDMPHDGRNQRDLLDFNPSKDSATQLCRNGNSKHRADKPQRSNGLQTKKTETDLTRSVARESARKDDSSSPTCERERPRSKSHNGLCMITHFDDQWPVSEFGSDYADGRTDLPAEPPFQGNGQSSPERKSIRSILKRSKVQDKVPTNCIDHSLNGSVHSIQAPPRDPMRQQWNTLPNLHRFDGTTPSSSSAFDDADKARDHDAWKAKEESKTDAPEKRWKSESFLFLGDARSRCQNGKRKRFVIDYRRQSTGHVTLVGSGERRTIGPFTLNEFEQCLEIPAGQMNVQEVREVEKEEAVKTPKMEEDRPERPMNRLSNEETMNGKDHVSSEKDPSSDVFWLFHRVSRSDFHSWKGPKRECAGFPPQNNRSVATTATIHPADWNEESADDNNRKEVLKWKTGLATRQQYRWSTAIREPQARILLDQRNVGPPLSLTPPRNRYRIAQPGRMPLKKYQTTDVDSVLPDDIKASTNERAFTITGQRKPSSPVRKHSDDGQSTTNYALVGVSHLDRSKVPPVQVSSDWQNETAATRFEDATPSPSNRKHRYLRERVLTEEASVDSNPDLTDPASAGPILSSSDVTYRSLQNLEQLQLSRDRPIHHETWKNSYASKSSLLSLPSNLLRQRNVDMSSVGSQDSVGETSAARQPRGETIVHGILGGMSQVSPMGRSSPPSQNQEDASGEDSTSDRSWSEKTNSSKESHGLGQLAVSSHETEKTPPETEKTPPAEPRRPRYWRTTKRVQQTPRAVKARHEMKARRVKSSDRSRGITPIANWNRHSYGPSHSSGSCNIRL